MPTKMEEYQAKLTVLKEKKKMHLLTQDQYDTQQAELSKEIFGSEEPKEK